VDRPGGRFENDSVVLSKSGKKGNESPRASLTESSAATGEHLGSERGEKLSIFSREKKAKPLLRNVKW